MSLIKEIMRGIDNPRKLLQRGLRNPKEVARRGFDGVRADLVQLHGVYQRRVKGRHGVPVMERDWDNLIIVDSCHYDLFEECNPFERESKRVLSTASATLEFLEKNFAGYSFPDTVYVTANPNCNHLDAEFHAVARLWEDHWNEELQTVTPDAVVEQTLEIFEQHPDKRFIVHFIQPHYPFVGKSGREIDHGSFTGRGVIADARDNPTIWDRLKNSTVSHEKAWRAYRENLELTFPHVERLIEKLDGKTVITSDHGNEFGKWGEYGHRSHVFLPGMVEVPWLEISNGSRRRIVDGETETISGDGEHIDERLSALGYK